MNLLTLWGEMASDISIHVQQPLPVPVHKLTPRQISTLHTFVMGAVRRREAMRANTVMMGCGVAFNGDKEGGFRKFINRMIARPVFKLIGPQKAVVQNVTDESAKAAALALAERLASME